MFKAGQTIKHKRCIDLVVYIIQAYGGDKYEVLYLTKSGRLLSEDQETIKLNNPENWSLFEVKNDSSKRKI